MAFKKCKNDGCEVQIEVRNTDLGWRPFEESGNKHNCQFSDYAKKQRQLEDKNDHGNELVHDTTPPKTEYVDHTQQSKGQQKVKFFIGTDEEVEQEYNEFRWVTQGKINVFGTQLAVDNGIIYFSLNYEETKQ